MERKDIIGKYKKLHDELTERYYKNHELTKEEFDLQHGQIWQDMEEEMANEGYVSPKPRDLVTEIDDLKARLEKLEKV